MAEVIRYFFAPEDEELFFDFLARYELELFPETVPPDWRHLKVERSVAGDLELPAYYLAATRLAPPTLLPVKRGKHKGMLMIDEKTCPVVSFERSRFDAEGVLRSGQLWANLDLQGTIRRDTLPEPFRQMWLAIREYLTKTCVRSRPVGWLVAPGAARLSRRGTVLRDADHKGVRVEPYR